MWDPVMNALTARRQVVRYDLLGHGHTPDPSGDRTLDDFVEQLVGVMDDASSDPVDVAGLSIGGLIALAAVVRHPERVRRVAALNTVFGRTSAASAAVEERLRIAERDGMAPIAGMAIDRWFTPQWQQENRAEVENVRGRIETTNQSGYVKAYRVFASGDPLMPDAAADIEHPLLALTGDSDVGSTPTMSENLAAAAQRGRAVILNDCRHLPTVEHPGVLATHLNKFFEDQ